MAKKQRLDKAIAMQGSLSRSEVKTLIRKGAVTVNGQVVKMQISVSILTAIS